MKFALSDRVFNIGGPISDLQPGAVNTHVYE
jgi:hypothetical protein